MVLDKNHTSCGSKVLIIVTLFLLTHTFSVSCSMYLSKWHLLLFLLCGWAHSNEEQTHPDRLHWTQDKLLQA